jgi:hypothetical protein
VPASRRKGLVISEWAFNRGAGYYTGGFLELYNNADTTIYLDGIVVAQGLDWEYDRPTFPCALLRPYSEDPQGIWTLAYQVFPGDGDDYPVSPGGIVVVATDAIDHRPFFAGTLDLSAADFEFVGTSDPDNPAVPNMVNTGYDSDLAGHGVEWSGLGAVAVVALPFDTTGLVTTVYPGSSTFAHPRIPREAIVDVLSMRTYFDNGLPQCARIVNDVFDRDSFRGRGSDGVAEFEYSVSRRPLPIRIAGRPVLQVTRTSDSDFLRSPRTPSVVVNP